MPGQTLPPKRAYEHEGKIRIFFPYDPVTVAKVKEIPGRKYHADNPKHWTCPVSAQNAATLRDLGFTLADELLAFVENPNSQPTHSTVTIPPQFPGLRHALLPFQQEGVAFLEQRYGNALLADEMGVGKTVQALAYLALHPELRPAVVVCPASLKYNWEAEALKWLEDAQPEVLSGKTPWIPTGKILIINYDILSSWVEVLQEIDPPLIICDEAHALKNPKAQRTQAVKRLAKRRKFIALTGTPILNKPVEAFTFLNLVDPEVFNNWWHYTTRYCNAKQTAYGWDVSGASNTDELHRLLTSTVMLRRKKKDVLPQLPDKLYSIVPIELSVKGRQVYTKTYNSFMGRFRKRITDVKNEMKRDGKSREAIAQRVSGMLSSEAMVQLEALQQASADGKIDQAIEWIKDFLDNDEKLIVFCRHKTVIDRLMKAFGKITVKVDGSVAATGRREAVERFQNDPAYRLFVGNLQAASEGLTLTAASAVAFIEFPWTPAALMQAEDRAHRIGQKDTVNVYFLVGKDTADTLLISIIDGKRKIVDRLVDGTDAAADGSLIGELLLQMAA